VLHLELPGLNREKVTEFIEKNQTDSLYRYLLLTQCNALNEALPKMFERIGSYTELLLPGNLLKADSVPGRMVSDIPEDDWKDQVQIIGWLYQYYNSELKDETFALLKKNVKITKERIPSATQLFTPDWIVRYMVENSLGRLWLEGHPDAALRAGWRYYLDEAAQEPEVQAQLEALRAEYRELRPQEIKVIDPCMGSGHILVYAFDVLMQIYESTGVSQRDAAQSILQNNLFGLDIDPRAAQLAYFAVMMKARQYDRRIFSRGIQPNLYSAGGYPEGEDFGSLITVDKLEEKPQPPTELSLFDGKYEDKLNAWNFRRLLAQKYDVVCTNPPYMGGSGMSAKLGEFVKKNYLDSKSDLFAVFIERCGQLVKQNGYQAMITQHAWMFLSSYEKLRKKLQLTDTINMAHLGPRAFEEIGGEVVQTTSFVMRKSHVKSYKGTYCRLIKPTTQQGKEDMFLAGENRYAAQQDNFSKIPGSPIAYWVSEKFIQLLGQKRAIGNTFDSGSGLSTADNDRFLSFFWEVSKTRIATIGIEKKKWYGNLYYVVNWENDGSKIKYWVTHNPKDPNTTSWSRRIFNTHLYFKKGVTWSVISSGSISFRATDENAMISNAAGGILGFSCEQQRDTFMAALNTKIWTSIFKIINPTLNYSSGVIQKAPTPILPKTKLGSDCVCLSKTDWDAFETSWDFKKHPLV